MPAPRFLATLTIVCLLVLLLPGGCPAPPGEAPLDGTGGTTGSGGQATGNGTGSATDGSGGSGSATGGTGSDATDGSGGTDGTADDTGAGGGSGTGGTGSTGGSSGTGGSPGGDTLDGGGATGTSAGCLSVPQLTPVPQQITSQIIAQTGDPVPGQSGATFTWFGNPVIDADGRVAFWAGFAGGSGNAGIYVWHDGTLTRVIDDRPGQPDTPVQDGAVNFADPADRTRVGWDSGALPLAWGSGGRLLFVARFNGSSLPNGLFRWRASDGSIVRVADAQMLAAVFPQVDEPDGFLVEFFQPGLSDDGIVIFAARYTFVRSGGELVFFRDTGLFHSNGVTITPVVAAGLSEAGDVPDDPLGTGMFAGAGLLPAVTPCGDLLVQGQVTGTSLNRGIYLLRDDTLLRVVDNRSGLSVPGLPGGARIGQSGQFYPAMAIGDGPRIAVQTTITVGAQTHATVIYWNGTQWQELTGTGGQIADRLLTGINQRGQTVVRAAGRVFLTDGDDVREIGGSLAQIAGSGAEWDEFGGALNNHGRVLLRFVRGAEAGVAFWTGQALRLVADPHMGVPAGNWEVVFATGPVENADLEQAPGATGTVRDRPETDRPGRSGMLNDADQMVLRLGAAGADGQPDTADDRQAIVWAEAQ